MAEQNKLQRLLEIMVFLSSGIKYTLPDIAERFSISERTAYRYICTFREAGFILPKPENGRYFIDKNSPYFREISELLHFSKEEAIILQKAIHSVSNENMLKQNLTKKLYSIYDFGRVPDTVVKAEHSANIHSLIQAIKYKNRVVLRGYLSANSKALKDRVVEPFDFTTNYIAVWAFDVDTQSCKTFKVARIQSVQTLAEPWKHEKEHKQLPIDVFRISSNQQIEVELLLSIRAAELLAEEYPLAEQYIRKVKKGQYRFKSKVASLDGVGRFVMGLCNEIKIVAPQSLKDYVRKRAKVLMADTS